MAAVYIPTLEPEPKKFKSAAARRTPLATVGRPIGFSLE